MKFQLIAALAAYAAAAECDASAMSFEGFSDNACETADETITATIEATVEAAAEFYSGECEYMGDEAGVSIIVECTAEGFSYIATTTQELGAAALAASATAMVLLATL